MKKIYTFLAICLMSIALVAQTPCPDCPPNSGSLPGDSATNFLTSAAQMDFVPGQILVRFKDDLTPVLRKSNGYVALGVPTLDAILQKYKVTSAEKVFPNEQRRISRQMVKTFSGKELEVPSLHNIHKLETDSMVNIFEAIEALKQDENVIYAEPNYIYSVVESEALSPALTEAEMIEWLKENPIDLVNQPLKVTGVSPNDPLYSQQWGIPATQIDAVWDSTTGDTTQIIAILDTGVDWLHPDLKNKIWHNPGEIPDNGIDDDGNGKIDDVIGWDWINHDNNPMDDNSHGTHVAGIAAAESNNGIGIAGVNWGAKIMPLKVFQSSGRGDVLTITQGIIYAKAKGATVINMSFGSYARSLTMEDVLANAYATTILVAAAGNDSRGIGPCLGCAPFFPAALSYILGTESSTYGGSLSEFSNFDQDGPVFSYYNDLLNYELRSPGTGIISAIPNGGYRVYNGTSMATPLLAAGLSLYRGIIFNETPEYMWVKLISSSQGHIQFLNALAADPEPNIQQIAMTVIDSCQDCDKDGRVDAGETIELWFRLRNVGGHCDSVFYSIKLAEFEDTTTAQILVDRAFVGSISPYATRNASTPLKIRIGQNVAHGRDIVFNIAMWWKGGQDTTVRTCVLTPENGEELFGVLDSTKILYANRLYLVNRSFKIGVDGTLMIQPGTKILFYGYTIPVSGRLIAEGKPDSMIHFQGYNTPGGMQGPLPTIFSFRNSTLIRNRLSYCIFENLSWPLSSDNYMNPASVFDSKFINSGNYSIGIVDSVVNNLVYSPNEILYTHGYTKGNNFIGPNTSSQYYFSSLPYSLTDLSNLYYNNFINYRMNYDGNGIIVNPEQKNNWISEYMKYQRVWNGTFYTDQRSYLEKYSTYRQSVADFQEIQHQYWGTSDSIKIENMVGDFMEHPTWPRAKFWPFLTSPVEAAHGVVWKILVNGKDSQDETVDPLGIGKHRFDIYFNRPMDKTSVPIVGFGVRYPFSSNNVNEDSEWSLDGRIYTTYKTVKIYTGDGINRIRVSGAKDLEGWEIPVEDMRFEFLIDAAGSASVDFQATAGLGKVNLEWSNPSPEDVPDLLGYNMYRLEHINDTTLTQPIMINSTLISDTLFTDFDVVPNKKYYYYYRVVRTDFSESDSSKVISSIPFTAAVGDANGDLTVNILDITSIVGYLLNQNPQPFILEAADVNHDGQINILDVVGVVNQIMGGVPKFAVSKNKPTVSFDSKAAYIENCSGLTAMQFKLSGKDIAKAGLVMGPAAKGMELSYSVVADTMYVVLYNFKNNGIVSDERGMLFTLTDGYFKELKELIGSDAKGESVEISVTNDGEIIPKEYQLYQNYPNPFNPNTTIRYALPNPGDVELIVYNILGQKVWDHKVSGQKPGYYEVVWNGKNNYGSPVASGVYIYQLRSGKFFTQKKMSLLK